MKILFEDGILRNLGYLSEGYWVVDAREGVEANIAALDFLAREHPDAMVYTNSIFALHRNYTWNAELGAHEAYIYIKKERYFVRIDALTKRELKEGHNIAKMYVSGEFERRSEAELLELRTNAIQRMLDEHRERYEL